MADQHVLDTNDEGLRRYTHERLKVFAKFTSEDCATCELLAPQLRTLARNETYQHILFLQLNADENPVAKKIMQEKVAPFFVSYCQGRMLECDMLTTELQVLGMLERLRTYQPLAS